MIAQYTMAHQEHCEKQKHCLLNLAAVCMLWLLNSQWKMRHCDVPIVLSFGVLWKR